MFVKKLSKKIFLFQGQSKFSNIDIFPNRIPLIGIMLTFCFYLFYNRGLSLDGSHNLLRMILNNSFYQLEFSRILFAVIQQLPAYIFIKYSPFNSISFLVKIFSFGLIWIHIISFLGCYFILPERKKYYIFFPLLAFYTGPLTALGISISASLSVFSYVYLTAFVIHYSDFSIKTHKLLFFLTPIPLFLSHEMMSYMAWPLIYLSLLKLNRQQNYLIDKFIIKTVISFLLIISVSSVFFIMFQNRSETLNRTEFFMSFFYLEFFFKIKDGSINVIHPSTISSFFLLILPFGDFLKQNFRKFFSIVCLSFIGLFGLASAVLPFYELFAVFNLTNEEEARVWVVCIALPLTLLIWWLFENNKLQLKKSFFLAFSFIAISLTGWRIGSDYQFYQYQNQFSKEILKCKGIVDWNEIFKNNRMQYLSNSSLFRLFNLSWKYMSSSLIYPRKKQINIIIKSENHFYGCYQIPPYGMCENSIPRKNNKFFNFEKIIYYEKNNISECHK